MKNMRYYLLLFLIPSFITANSKHLSDIIKTVDSKLRGIEGSIKKLRKYIHDEIEHHDHNKKNGFGEPGPSILSKKLLPSQSQRKKELIQIGKKFNNSADIQEAIKQAKSERDLLRELDDWAEDELLEQRQLKKEQREKY